MKTKSILKKWGKSTPCWTSVLKYAYLTSQVHVIRAKIEFVSVPYFFKLCFVWFYIYTTVAYMSRLIEKMCGCDQISNYIYLTVYTVFKYENVLHLWPCGLFKCTDLWSEVIRRWFKYRSIHIRYEWMGYVWYLDGQVINQRFSFIYIYIYIRRNACRFI